MGMIYFAGLLDDRAMGVFGPLTYPQLANPVCIRGYDEAGNLLSKIRCDNPVSIARTELFVGGIGTHHYYFNARDRAGVEILPYARLNNNLSPSGILPAWIACFPYLVAANQAGEVFGFYSVGEHSHTKSVALIDNDIPVAAYIDPFRIYNRDGHRMPAPDIFAEPETFEIDEDDNFYLGGFARTLSDFEYLTRYYSDYSPQRRYFGAARGSMGLAAHVFRKYDRAGNLLWSIPGYSDVYSRVVGLFYLDTGNYTIVEQRRKHSIDCVLDTAWDSLGYLYLAGISEHVPEETPSSPTNYWEYCYGSQVRVRKVDPADGTVLWDHFFSHIPIDEITWDSLQAKSTVANLVIHDDILYLVYNSHLFKIDTDGEEIANAPMALSAVPDVYGAYPKLAPSARSSHYFGDALQVMTRYSGSSNPQNLHLYDPADLSLLERRTTQWKWDQPEKILNDVKYLGMRQAYSISGWADAWSIWHYLAENADGDSLWTQENLETPGLHGQVARDDDGFNYVKDFLGTPIGEWPDSGSILVTIDDVPQYLTILQYYEQILRFTDAYGRQVGPDATAVQSSFREYDIWLTNDISAVANSTLNSIAIALRLEPPLIDSDRYAEPPGLPFWIGVAVQRWLLEPIVKGAAQIFYRIQIDGDPPLYLQPSFFSVRSSIAADTALSVTCPNPGAAALALLNEREGAVLRLQTGFRQGNHPVQYTDYLVTTLETARSDSGPRSNSVALTGNAPARPVAGRRRAVYGLSYRRATAAGAQTWRAIPDPYLDPGDVATWGGEEITATQITISVSTTQATMEINEVAD